MGVLCDYGKVEAIEIVCEDTSFIDLNLKCFRHRMMALSFALSMFG